jgi:hypothetical protein
VVTLSRFWVKFQGYSANFLNIKCGVKTHYLQTVWWSVPMTWVVRGLNPSRYKRFSLLSTHSDRPWRLSSLFYSGYKGSGVTRPGRGCDQTGPLGAEVRTLQFFTPTTLLCYSWQVMGRPLPSYFLCVAELRNFRNEKTGKDWGHGHCRDISTKYVSILVTLTLSNQFSIHSLILL